MGWSYRKSFSSGPFRINFSKSGISYSVGVKGARINTDPRGTYVNLSSHGISYRKKISDPGQPAHPNHTPTAPAPYYDAQTIASAAIERLTDIDSKDFVAELSQKAAQISYVSWFGIFPLLVFITAMLFIAFGSRTTISKPASDSTIVRVTSPIGLNIRQVADPRSPVVKAALYNQNFLLLDSSNQKWLKIALHDTVAYINRRFAAIEHVHHDEQTSDALYLANSPALYLLAAGIPLFTWLIVRLKKADKIRFEMALQYDMDDKFRQVYEQFTSHFKTFAQSARIWQHLNAYQTNDYKRTGGAGKLIKRASIRGISTNRPLLPHFVTNVAIPCIRLSNLELYFLPERLLVKRNNTFAAVFYKHLQIDSFTTRFIEDESVPGDARIVDHTWRYVNKHGGPDRRFNNNRQIPVCAYSEYTLTSGTGIYEVLMTSKQGAMDGFAHFLTQIGELQSQMQFSE